MKGFIRQLSVFMATIMVVTLVGCVGGQSQSDGFDVDSDLDVGSDNLAEADAPKDTKAQAATSTATSDDDFADFGDNSQDVASKPSESAAANDDDLSLEDEITHANGDANAQAQQKPAETAPAAPEEDPFADPPAQTAEIPPPAPEEPQETAQAPVLPPDLPAELPAAPIEPPTPEPVVAAPAPPMAAPVEITGLRYQANDTGGTVVVQANGPLTYTTRSNPDLKQFIVEVDNAHLPKKLTRNLNTKDIRGTIGTVDAYQNPGSNTARFVIQLRDGAVEPAVQAEGNSLVIASSHAPEAISSESVAQQSSEPKEGGEGEVTNVSASGSDDKMLASQNLSDFMAGNTKFYGKKISIETSNMEVRDALKFITDETGVNMVISDEVRGNLSLKLRQVPWDQALVMILKARKLGYTRQGSVLRIAPLADLKQEEDDAAKLAATRKGVEPLKVRMFPVNFAKVDDLEKKIKDFLSERGKAVGDVRTNSLVVTDIEDNLGRIAKLIASLDIQPPQVLIEGKIVEANEEFTRQVGISWGASGQPVKIGNSSRGPVNMRPTLAVGQSEGTAANPLLFGLNIGTLDLFGNLTASLSLNERENNVKVLSSPRIVAMSNEKANITQTTEIPLTTTTLTGNVAQTTVQFKPLTLKLEVTPQVTADASVIMNVLVNRQFLGANAANTGDTQLPVNSREAQTKVLVHNGQTAVIGGIYQSDTSLGTHGVPWFKDLPVVGTLFRGTDNRKQKVELMIFLTPRILGQTDAPADANSSRDF